MNSSSGELLLLLKLRDGLLSPTDGFAARERLANERDLRQKWQQLQAVAPSGVASASADEIAEYLEGRMAVDDYREFEQRCWQSAELLSEVSANHQAFVLPAAELSDSLTARLLQLDALRSEPQQEKSRDNRTLRTQSSQNLNPRRGWFSARAAGLLIATTAVLAVAIFYYVGTGNDDEAIGPPPIARDEGSQPSDNKAVPNAPQPKPGQSPGSIAKTPEVPLNPTPNDSTEQQIVDSPNPIPQKTVPVPPIGFDPALVPNTHIVAKSDFQWSQILGVVGVYDVQRTRWSGVQATGIKRPSRFQTLSDSRVNGRYRKQLSFIAGPNTEFEFNDVASGDSASALQTAPVIRIQSGQMSLLELVGGQDLRFLFGDKQSSGSEVLLSTVKSKTEIEILFDGTNASLLVRNGEVRINKRRVNKGQMIPLSGSRANVTRIDRRIERIADFIPRSQIPDEVQLRLLASNDISKSIPRYLNTIADNSPQHTLLKMWSFDTGDPVRIAADLDSSNRTVRDQIFRWLQNVPPQSERGRQVWDAIAAKTGEQRRPVAIQALFVLLKTGQMPSLELAKSMLQGLNSQSVAIRYLSITLLRRFYKEKHGFNPDATRDSQKNSRDAWTASFRKKLGQRPGR